ncbi:radical SAM protein [Candidatus Woesearchaeota archaeon]|nr:radical SAM protein [Candidatus Woesearchaeota archaeon]
MLDSLYAYSCRKLGFSIPLRRLNFAVTYRCNSKCLTCNIWKTCLKNPSLAKKELYLKDIKSIFSQFKDLKFIGITGGEPFLREDLIEIVESIKVPYVSIPTNALMPKRVIGFVEKMVEIDNLKQLDISVSIDAIGKLNDKIRGVPGSYDKSIEALKLLKKLQRKNDKIVIGISTTISKANVNEIIKVYKLAEKLDVAFFTRLAHSSSLYYENISSKIFVDETDMPYIERIFKFLLKKQPRNLFYRHYLNRFLENPSKQPVPCFSGFNSFFIDPYGNLYPCIMLNRRIGNLKGKVLKQLLDSKETKDIRKSISDGECSCWTECEALNSIYSNPVELLKKCIY